MRESLQQETEKLARSWMRHDQALLKDYLVADVEDPRINLQSMISRQYLISALTGGRFQELMDRELHFAVSMNWLNSLQRKLSTRDEWQAVAYGLERGANEVEGIEIPHWISRIHAGLPMTIGDVTIPAYLSSRLRALADEPAPPSEETRAGLDLFLGLWRQVLEGVPAPDPRPTVIEPACGSANDYRFMDACGLHRLMDYTGFDLCEKNVLNARSLFPKARFEAGNVFEIAAADRGVDYVFAHDLFEHLSPEGLEKAIAEVCRVTRRGFCLGFFNMDEIPSHIVRPVENYHWNTLSMELVRDLFAGEGWEVRVVHVGTFLRWAAGCEQTHNSNAYTLISTNSTKP